MSYDQFTFRDKGTFISGLSNHEQCSIGSFYDSMLQYFLEYGFEYFSAFGSFGQTVLVTWGAIWLAWVFYTFTYATDKFNKDEVSVQFIRLVVVNLLYQGWGIVWELIWLILSTGLWAMNKSLEISTGQTQDLTLSKMVCAGAYGIYEQADGFIQSTGSFSYLNPIVLLFTLVFVLVFNLLWFRVIGAFIDPVGRIIGVLATLGITTVLVLFNPFRAVPLANLKILISSMIEFSLIGGLFGVVITMFDAVATFFPLDSDGNLVVVNDFWGSPRYWTIIFGMLFIWLAFKQVLGVVQSQLDMVITRGSGVIRNFT